MIPHMGWTTLIFGLLVLISLSSAALLCIPDVPASILPDATILQHPAVKDALQQIQDALNAVFTTGTHDGLSFAIIHASTPDTIFSFNRGFQRLNESSSPSINSDSIFRVNSISKSITAASALAVINQSKGQVSIPRLTLDSLLVDILPSFNLPQNDWVNGGSEITLSMLGTESSGLCREGYQTDFNDVSGLAQASAAFIGGLWASATPESVIQNVAEQGLIFAPSQRASYSNAGFALLGYGIANYRNRLKGGNLTWSEAAVSDILQPLNMSHSFFGPIPNKLKSSITIPYSIEWTDMLVTVGYDPAAGMWASANDLTSYLYNMWLKPSPELITPMQRRTALQPRISLPDGAQQLGFGWEISLLTFGPENSTYSIYGKSGDGGGYHSYISTTPNLGFGLVVLTTEGSSPSANYTRLFPETIASSANSLLIPAFRTAYSSLLASKYAGNYTLPNSTSLDSSYALVEVENDVLYLRQLVYGNVSALLRIDMLDWTPDDQPIYFSGPSGSALAPSDVGKGANFRIFAEAAECDYFDFDGYTDENGWALDRVQFLEHASGTVEIVYPPLDARLVRK